MLARLIGAGAAFGMIVLVADGCSKQDCCGGCPGDQPAVFQLTCASTDLASVTATGPCASDAGLSSYEETKYLAIRSQSPGVCHVVLTFATGFTYSADVTFATQPGGVCGGPQCKCGDYVAPTSGPFAVKNPSATCVDAGLDAAAEAAPNVCPSEASQSVPCSAPTTCTGCRFDAMFECTCALPDASTAEGGGLAWQCTDTGFPCTPPSP